MEYISPISKEIEKTKLNEVREKIADVLDNNFQEIKNGYPFYKKNKELYDRLMDEFKKGVDQETLMNRYFNTAKGAVVQEILNGPLFTLEERHLEILSDLRMAKQTASFENIDKLLKEYFSEIVHLLKGIESEFHFNSNMLMMNIRSAVSEFQGSGSNEYSKL